ncbi:dynein axonemal assembly factor 6-like [Lineus longissimus]|uniref:dynein axonemal assembly factor 6-like n=1 Tax=Lineus longissimus TaxID=88925 RepID=UPI002B4C3EF3
MEGMLGPHTMNALTQILKPPGVESDSDEEIDKTTTVSRVNPGDIGPKKSASGQDKKKEVANKKDIWDTEEVQEGAEFDDIHDPRPQPEYDIVYKQAVSSEDMFLQMGNKTPMTSSCEDMVVKIQLLDTKGSDIELDVKKTFLDCRTPKFKLGLHLPHPVDHKAGKAQWDNANHVLNVTLRIIRDYDMFNF